MRSKLQISCRLVLSGDVAFFGCLLSPNQSSSRFFQLVSKIINCIKQD